jgi:hypothetical protein
MQHREDEIQDGDQITHLEKYVYAQEKHKYHDAETTKCRGASKIHMETVDNKILFKDNETSAGLYKGTNQTD